MDVAILPCTAGRHLAALPIVIYSHMCANWAAHQAVKLTSKALAALGFISTCSLLPNTSLATAGSRRSDLGPPTAQQPSAITCRCEGLCLCLALHFFCKVGVPARHAITCRCGALCLCLCLPLHLAIYLVCGSLHVSRQATACRHQACLRYQLQRWVLLTRMGVAYGHELPRQPFLLASRAASPASLPPCHSAMHLCCAGRRGRQ